VLFRCLIAGLLLSAAIVCGRAADQSPASKPDESRHSSPSPSAGLAPFKERLAAAQSVRVETRLLGLDLDASLEKAHEILDPLGTPTQPSVEAAGEAEEGEHERKVLWKLTKSDFSSILVKTDEQERVIYILGFLRPGKEVPFDQIGQTDKAPILTEHTAAWDVVRPDKSLLRVVARGEKRKASAITIFVVKRPRQH
jgi:hypothetical protein